MKSLALLSCFLVFQIVAVSIAAPESLFPDKEEMASPGTSLSSAVNQFDQIIESSSTGTLSSLDANTDYNQQRINELQEQLEAKRDYLEELPKLASRHFETMLAQYPDADQQQKDKIAYQIQSEYQSIENRTLREIEELKRQLELSGNRVGEARMQRQMIEISDSISQGRKTLEQKTTDQEKEQRPHKSAFEYMQSLSHNRIRSRVKALGAINVRSLDQEFTNSFLGK